MTFNAKEYARALASHGVVTEEEAKVTKESERPVTLADHEAAECEARQLVETRLRDGCAIPEISEFEETIEELEELRDDAVSIQIWAHNLATEAEGWEETLIELLRKMRPPRVV